MTACRPASVRFAPLRVAAALLVLSGGASTLHAATQPERPLPPPALVSGEWLQLNRESREVRVLDARPVRDFRESHVPGAQNVTPDNLRSTAGGVPLVGYPAEVLAAILARAGVSRRSHVVVYGAATDPDATYVATAARIGGAAQVSVLDGGFTRWSADGRPVTKERRLFTPSAADLHPDPLLLAPIDDVKKRVGDGKTVFLDVRPEAQWAAGRLPGAINRFWKQDLDDGTLRPNAELKAEYEAAGVSWSKPVVVYCNSGHQASESFWVLKYVLGHPDVKLYQGSWLEWSMTPGTPRESSVPAEPAPK